MKSFIGLIVIIICVVGLFIMYLGENKRANEAEDWTIILFELNGHSVEMTLAISEYLLGNIERDSALVVAKKYGDKLLEVNKHWENYLEGLR